MRSGSHDLSQTLQLLWHKAQRHVPALRDRCIKTNSGTLRLRVIAPVCAAVLMASTALLPAVTGVEATTAAVFASLWDNKQETVAQLAAVAPAAGAANIPVAAVQAQPKVPYMHKASYQVKSGDTLSDVLERAEVPSGDRHEIALELKKAGFDVRTLKEGQKLDVEAEVQPSGQKIFKGMEFKISPFKHYQVASASGSMTAKAIETPLRDVVVSHSLPVKGSVYESMRAAGVPRQLVGNFLKPFAHFVDFQRDIRAGQKNRVEVLYSGKQTMEGDATVPGDITYAALIMGDKRVALYRFETEDGSTEFFTEDGKSGKRLLMKTPIDGARLSSGFGMRKHPVLGYSKMHKGVDFAASTGTPIYAAGDGVVEKAGPFSSYGNYVLIRHTGGYKTAYAHMSRYAKGMRAGKRVKQGEVIGYVGTTGRSTGAHLHYEVMVGGRQVNPATLNMAGGVELAGKDMTKFKAHVQQVKALFKKSQQLPVAQVQNVSF